MKKKFNQKHLFTLRLIQMLMNVLKGFTIAIRLGNVLILLVVITVIAHRTIQAVLLTAYTTMLNILMETYGTQTLINALNVPATKA